MGILTKEEFEQNKVVLMEDIWQGKIFLHPTDTIYGIGCNALLLEAVKKVREIKQRYEAPFSVIVPSREWVRENCVISNEAEKWLKKLPGPYTLILKLKNKECISPNVSPALDSLGIRMPEHWFSGIVKELAFPVVTTSANVSGDNFMTSIENLDERVKNKVDFIIYEGEKHGRPSKIIDLTKRERVIER